MLMSLAVGSLELAVKADAPHRSPILRKGRSTSTLCSTCRMSAMKSAGRTQSRSSSPLTVFILADWQVLLWKCMAEGYTGVRGVRIHL